MLAKLSVYIATYVSAVGLRHHEDLVALIHALLLVAVCALSQQPYVTLAFAIVFGVIMTIAEYICIQYGMWNYNQARYAFPTWLPFTWAIVGVFACDVATYIKTQRPSFQ